MADPTKLDAEASKQLNEKELAQKQFAEVINQQNSNALKAKLLALYKNQEARDNILEKGYNEEFYELEYKYNLQYNNINREISQIINSETPIPHYWKTAIENAKFFQINEKDKEILKYLTDVELKHEEKDKKSFTVYFHFSSNPFFEHPVLEKAYKFNKKEDTYVESMSTEIKWKGDAPNVKIVKKKIKKGKNISTITKEKIIDSFFNIFINGDDEDDEDENDTKPDVGTEADFILNDLVPFSMEYYMDLQKLGALDDHLVEDEELSEEDDDEGPQTKKRGGKKK